MQSIIEEQNITTVETTQIKELLAESLSFPDQAHILISADRNDQWMTDASQFLLTIKRFRVKVEAAFSPVAKKAYDAWKGIKDLQNKADEPFAEAEKILKPAIAYYQMECERKRREEEARLGAEQLRLEEESRLKQAQAAEEMGEHEVATSIVDAPVAPIVPVTLEPKKVQGVSFREVWKCEVTNTQELIKAIIDGKVSPQAISVNMEFLNKMARALKDDMKFPGVRVYSEKTVAAKG